MTDRLSQLLHDEASTLAVPTPDAAAVLTRGRRLHTRRRLGAGLAALGTAAVVATTAGVVVLGGDSDRAREAGPATAVSRAEAAYGVGSRVVVGEHVARVPDTVHSLHYTSAGVLVRSNPNAGASDGSGPESLTLVTDDGDTIDLGTVPEGVGPATDPAQDVYVLAEASGSGFEAVVRDARTGAVEQRVPLPDLPPSYWDVPPLALDGQTLYAGYRKETVALDLTSGRQRTVPGMPGGLPEVHGARFVVEQDDRVEVLDATNGEVLRTVEIDPNAFLIAGLSPDGRYLRVVEQTTDTGETTVYAVRGEGEHTYAGTGWGWTPEGVLLGLEGDVLTRCAALTGECEETTAPVSPGSNEFPRLGGVLYES